MSKHPIKVDACELERACQRLTYAERVLVQFYDGKPNLDDAVEQRRERKLKADVQLAEADCRHAQHRKLTAQGGAVFTSVAE